MSVRRLTRWIVAGAAIAILAACGSSSGPGSASYAMGVTQTAISTTLGTTISITVNLTSDGFAGPVSLSVLGAPVSWQVALAPSATVNLVDGGVGSATINVTIPSNGAPATSGQVLTVHATASAGTHDATSTVTVANEYVLRMPNGTGAGAHWGLFNGQTINLKAGTTFTVRNEDTISHQIHTNDGVLNYPSQAAPMGQGETYSRVVGVGTDTIYCNVHGMGVGTFNLVVT